jgi:hypothetical protein
MISHLCVVAGLNCRNLATSTDARKCNYLAHLGGQAGKGERYKESNAHVIYTRKSKFIKNEHARYTFERYER